MPIKGLTDRGLSFPQIGSIKLGTKKVASNGKEYPADLQFFRVVFDDQEAEAMAMFIEEYKGLDVTEINIMFPFNDLDRVWDVWLEAYTAGRLWARSDGETFHYLADPEGGEALVVNGLDRNGNPMVCDPNQPVGKDYQGKPVYLKPTGRLKVVIPELVRGAYLVLRTGSYHNVANISSQLAGIQEVIGKLAGVPLVLRRRPKEISTPGKDGKRARREKWLVSIEISPVWMRERFGGEGLLGLPIGTGPAMLLPQHANGDDEPFEEIEGEIVEDEELEPEPELEKKPTKKVTREDVEPKAAVTDERLDMLVKAKLGTTDPEKIAGALALSKILTDANTDKHYKFWMSYYLLRRKERSEDGQEAAADHADSMLADLLANEAG